MTIEDDAMEECDGCGELMLECTCDYTEKVGTKIHDKWETIGNNDLRFMDGTEGGFNHIALYDADDHDLIIVNEDDIKPLIKRLQKHVEEHNL